MTALSEAFKKETLELSVQRVRLTSILSFSLFSLFGLLDYFVFPDKLAILLGLRFLNAALALSVLFLSYRDFGKRHPTLLGALDYLSLGFIISGMVFLTGGHESIYYTGLIVIIIGICYIMPWSLNESIPLCSAVYLSYVSPIVLFDRITNPKLFINSNFFLLCTIFIIIVSTYFGNRLRFREFESRYNLDKAKVNLETAYSQLQELDKLKTQFFSNISHELRTPLTLILAPSESLLKGEAGEFSLRAKERLEVVYHNALRLLKLIDDLLDIAKIDAQKMSLDLKKGNLVELIRGILASLSDVAEKKRLTLNFTEKNSLPEFYFDRDKIEKVILNLASNALKFTESGGQIEFTTKALNNKAVITVRDTGIGIAKEDLPKIFNRFVQLDGSTTRRTEGTGIGLALCKELVLLHKGEIRAESDPDRGTTITVELPLRIEGVASFTEATGKIEPEESQEEKDWIREIHQRAQMAPLKTIPQGVFSQGTQGPSITKINNGHKVLVVEDNPDMLQFITSQLQGRYVVIGASNGKEGLKLAKEHLPDLVITDIMMPEMSGYDLLKAMREDFSLKNIPIIFLTAKAGVDMKIEGLEYGADDYLVKPFNSEELLARVRNLIMLRELQREIFSVAKMASVGQLAAGVAHEINNPLNFSLSSLRALEKDIDKIAKKESVVDTTLAGKLKEEISLAREGEERIEKIVRDLMSFSKKDQAGTKRDDVHSGIESTLSLLEHDFKGRITIHKEYCSDGSIECNLGKLNQVVMNVLLNSIQAIKERGNIWIETERRENSFVISIKDDGVGIKKEHLDKVFDSFFTTKEIGQGIGLGLTVSYNLVKEQGGEIVVESDEGQGTKVTIAIPVKQG